MIRLYPRVDCHRILAKSTESKPMMPRPDYSYDGEDRARFDELASEMDTLMNDNLALMQEYDEAKLRLERIATMHIQGALSHRCTECLLHWPCASYSIATIYGSANKPDLWRAS